MYRVVTDIKVTPLEIRGANEKKLKEDEIGMWERKEKII